MSASTKRPRRRGPNAENTAGVPVDRLLDEKAFLTCAEVARVFRRDARAIRTAVANGEIPATKIGTKWHIPSSWVKRTMEGATQ
jgi:excisionase family DNA binding protein